MKKILLLSLILCPFISKAQLTHDTSFGDNGFVFIDWPTNGSARMYAQLQTDGKIIVSGNHIGSIPREDYIMRLEANGSIDLSYGTNGYYIIPNLTQDIEGPDIYLLPDNKLISYSNNYGTSIVKLTSQGILDSGFIQNAGYSPFDSQEFSIMDPQKAYLYFIQPTTPYGLQRLSTSTGLLDTTFGNAQHAISMPGGFNGDSEAAVQADEKITVMWETYDNGNLPRNTYVHRILPSGTYDPGFGTNGSTFLYETPDSSSDREECMVYDETGSLYVASRNWGTFDGSTIYKLDANGEPVLSFGTNGKIVLPDNHFILDVYVHNGNLYAIGRKMLSESFNDCNLLLVKYSLDGQPDTNFGTDGIYVEDGNPYLESAEDIVFTSEGELIVVGETNEAGLHRPFAVKYSQQLLQTQNFKANAISYQNPVNDMLVIKGTAVSNITLFGPDGRQAGFSFGNSLSTRELADGLYLAKITFENETTQTIKIIKR